MLGCVRLCGILWARTLERFVMPSPMGSSQPRDQPLSLTAPALAGGLFHLSTTREAPPDYTHARTHTHTHTHTRVIFPTEAGSPAVLRQKYLTFKTKSFRRPRSEPRKVCWASLAPGWPWPCCVLVGGLDPSPAPGPTYSVQQ